MFRGYNNPKKSDIFGPSFTGGGLHHARQRELYQEGEGIGSFFSSIFRKLLPFATKAAKTVAGSSLAKETTKALKESAISGLTNVASDVIGGQKTLDESLTENLSKARENIATAIKASDRKRPSSDNAKTKSKGKKKKKRRIVRKRVSSVLDDDYDEYE